MDQEEVKRILDEEIFHNLKLEIKPVWNPHGPTKWYTVEVKYKDRVISQESFCISVSGQE